MQNPWDFNKKEEVNNSSQQDRKDKKENKALQEKKIEDLAKEVFRNLQNSNNNSQMAKYRKYRRYKKIAHIAFLSILTIWLLSGLYKVNSDENAVVLYFGKYYETTTPGLHFYIPAPIGSLVKIPVKRINKEEFGFLTSKDKNQNSSDEESLILTGDENIADIDFEVQWKINDVKNYLFNIENPQQTIRNATASVIREIIANKNIDDILANKKFEIESESRELLQNILNSYNSGVDIVTVQLLRADPPQEVIESFRDVQTAKADKERKINEAKSYSNDIMPKARGEAETLLQEAEAYKRSVISTAEGETSRFDQVYEEYKNNKNITKKRIYLETMEEVMKNNDKIIIDKNLNNNFIKLFDNKNDTK